MGSLAVVTVVCGECGGNGYVPDYFATGAAGQCVELVPCQGCGGVGKVPQETELPAGLAADGPNLRTVDLGAFTALLLAQADQAEAETEQRQTGSEWGHCQGMAAGIRHTLQLLREWTSGSSGNNGSNSAT
ncbi:MAG: hypothetical protein JO110_14635 [Acetobacteraceae bacterium]|nr:hypothetical protein [Acetobacteraceae bacterium]